MEKKPSVEELVQALHVLNITHLATVVSKKFDVLEILLEEKYPGLYKEFGERVEKHVENNKRVKDLEAQIKALTFLVSAFEKPKPN